ncbi:MAG: PEP/pyruvate-binding domain-containing protein [Chloroflexota bacterium]
MTPTYIVPLNDWRSDLNLLGGKGASLARLAQAGLPVPAGFIITTAAYQFFVTANGLKEALQFSHDRVVLTAPSSIEVVAGEIQKRFSEARIPAIITHQILHAYQALPGTQPAVALRSSATAEDLPDASYAGQQETYLNVSGPEAVLEAIKKCWASLWTARASSYRSRQGISTNQEAMAVVVQLMVPAECAGVLFTANPVTGNRNQAVISAAWGLGEAIVGGRVTADSLLVDKESGKVLERKTADKQVMTVRVNGGTAEQPVIESKRMLPVLDDANTSELTRLGVQIERLYRQPMDIEWARSDGMFSILQARPITALPEQTEDRFSWNDSYSGEYLWSNVNFGEAITEVMTPLTWSVLQFTLEDWIFVPGKSTVGIIGGYPYLNISIFASLYKAVGKSHQDLLHTLEPTIHIALPPDLEIPIFPLSISQFLSSVFHALQMQWRQMHGLRKLDSYLASNPAWFQQTLERIRGANDKRTLAALFENSIHPHVKLGVWCVLGTIQSANYTFQLRKTLMELVGPEDADLLIANVGNLSGSLASLGPVMGLEKVARGEMSREDYMKIYGHRGPHEFELSKPRPSEDPQWIERMLANQASSSDVAGLLQRQSESFQNAWQRLMSRHPRRAGALHRRIRESARLARLRESVRSEYVRDRWLLRLFALRAGELSGLGNDVFFLTLNEMLMLLAGHDDAIRFILDRKRAHGQYKSLPPYPTLVCGSFDPFAWSVDPNRRVDLFDARAAPYPTDPPNQITGSPGSAGQVEGIVRCLSRPEDGSQLQPGEILVAVQTDIAWTLIFPRAAAVITDVGAPLSHAAIVARELGIPAVVGCGNATQRLKTGDRVRVDGGRGTVTILC